MMADLLDKEERLQDTLEALLIAKDAIELSTELHPVRFLRQDCSYGLAYTVLTTVFSFFVYIIAALNGDALNE